MGVLDSMDNVIASINTYGAWRRLYAFQTATGSNTNPTATAGGPTNMARQGRGVTVPTMTGPIGMYLLRANPLQWSSSSLTGTPIVGLEYNLGSINLATGTFTDGVAMPTKKHSGLAAVQSATQLVGLGIDAGLTATTPTITVTYTDQDGNAGASAALVVPTNAVFNSFYLLNQVLANGDTGIRDVTNITKSAGTVGTISVYGYLILAASGTATSGVGVDILIDPMTFSHPLWLCETGDTIGLLSIGGQSTYVNIIDLLGVAET